MIAALAVAAGWPISNKVSALRVERLSVPELREDFKKWHVVSLGLSAVTALLSGVAMAMAGQLPATGAKPKDTAP